jgi:hypothetical protein
MSSAEPQPAGVLLDSCTRVHPRVKAHLKAEVVLRLVPVRLVQVVLIGVQIRVACILQRRSDRGTCVKKSTASHQALTIQSNA